MLQKQYDESPRGNHESHPIFNQGPDYRNQCPDTLGNKKARRGIGFVAVMLAVALLGGAVGGGSATWYFTSRSPAVQTIEVSVDEPAVPAQNISPASMAEPDVVLDGDVTSVVNKAAPSVVEISLKGTMQTFFGSQQTTSSGSGVILTEDGYIVTNNHVVENVDAITVRTSDGREFDAELIGSDAKTDLAVIKIDTKGLIPVTVADSDSVQVGQLAVAIGNPLGTLGGTVTSGIVSARDREITIEGQTMILLQTSAAINRGNSGGGLFDASGALIGIVNAKSGGLNVEGLGFAIPSNLMKSVTDDLIENGYVTGRPELGIKVLQVDDMRAAQYYGLSGLGVFVMEAVGDNGLKAGDRLISINGKQIEASQDVLEAVSASKAGDVMCMTVERGGEEMTLAVTVNEQIPESLRSMLPAPNNL